MKCPKCGGRLVFEAMVSAYICLWCGADYPYHLAQAMVKDVVVKPIAPEHQTTAQMQRRFELIINREFADMPTRWGYESGSH